MSGEPVTDTQVGRVGVYGTGPFRLEAWCGWSLRHAGPTLPEALTVAQQHEDTCADCRRTNPEGAS